MPPIPTPTSAGLAVKANDTGRVILVQRSMAHPHKHAAGKWEWPGGRLDPNETPIDAAKREWTEETGADLPDGDITGYWTAASGEYVAFVYLIATEQDIRFGQPTGETSAVAWWDPRDLPANPACRLELNQTDWVLLGHAGNTNPDGTQRHTGIALEKRGKKNKNQLTFGIDIDGTLTAADQPYRAICDSLRANGHKVVVITARADSKQFLANLGFNYDDLIIVDGGDNVGKNKAKVLKKIKAAFMMENRSASAQDIATACPVTLQYDSVTPSKGQRLLAMLADQPTR